VKVLAGDIGGTHARLATYRVDGGRPEKLREDRWPSPDYESLQPIVEAFLADEPEVPERACFGLAGPVEAGRATLPNLDWEVVADDLASGTGIAHVRLLNDFDAIGHGVLLLGTDELAVLQEGEGVAGAPVALVGAGTGLGVGYLDPSGEPPRVYSSEGGHAGFAPRDGVERGLAAWLAERHGRASRERVLSGDGLVDLYRYLRQAGAAAERPEVRAEMEEDDPAAVVSRHGLAGDDPLCDAALARFVGCYGAAAGDVALTLGARGGVYVAGGIAPKILDALREGPFMEAFRDKGRMRSYLEAIPVRVVLYEDVGLLGAAAAASHGAKVASGGRGASTRSDG
jgi:glucokinase